MHKLWTKIITANRVAIALGLAVLIGFPITAFGHFVVTIPRVDQSSGPDTSSPSVAADLAAHYGHLPLSCEPNVGQVDNEVAFVAHGNGANVFLTANGAVLDFSAPASGEPAESQFDRLPHATADRVLRLTLLGANANPAVVGELELPGRANYI